jgi:hypothetical protein
MSKEKIVRLAKERTRTNEKSIRIIYDNLVSKNRVSIGTLSRFNNGMCRRNIGRVEKILIECGAQVIRDCGETVGTKAAIGDLGITWGFFNCLPNGELIR